MLLDRVNEQSESFRPCQFRRGRRVTLELLTRVARYEGAVVDSEHLTGFPQMHVISPRPVLGGYRASASTLPQEREAIRADVIAQNSFGKSRIQLP